MGKLIVLRFWLSLFQFATRYEPLYTRRAAIISGAAEPTEEEVAAGEASNDSDDEDEDEEPAASVQEIKDGDEEMKGIPGFWLTALRNHTIIQEQITDKDAEVSRESSFGLLGESHSTNLLVPYSILLSIPFVCLQALAFLTDIKLEYLDTKQAGFKLLFNFAANEWFEDSTLEKTYYYQEEVGYGGDFVYDKAVGHEIKWKEDKDLTKKVEIKKQRNKSEFSR